MTPFKVHVGVGLLLVLVGTLVDFLFVEVKVSDAFKGDPGPYLASWKHQLFTLSVFYTIALGIVNVLLGFISHRSGSPVALDWAVALGFSFGAILLVATGFWYANAGPALKWETRCTVLTVGLLMVAASLVLTLVRVVRAKPE